jgi:hypothetical protein
MWKHSSGGILGGFEDFRNSSLLSPIMMQGILSSFLPCPHAMLLLAFASAAQTHRQNFRLPSEALGAGQM